MKRVLVTGATGFVGRNCIGDLLERGYEVHAVSFPELPARPHPGAVWHGVNLLNERATTALVEEVRPTHLLHLAWYVVPGQFWTAMDNYHWVGASMNLVEAFVHAGGRRMVGAGTCAEYDWGSGVCLEGTTPLRPVTPYGVCKHALNMMVESYAQQAGFSSAWGRIFFLFGPNEHEDRLVASVARSLLRGEPALTSHGRQIRDLLHVEDVASAFVTLLDSEVTGPVNIASGQPVPLKEVIERIAALAGRPELVRLGGRPAAPNDPPFLVADARRILEEVGWTPRYDLDSGLAQTIAWWRDRLA